jgi:hypothetical protein
MISTTQTTTQRISESPASAENSVAAQLAGEQPPGVSPDAVATSPRKEQALDPTRYGDWEKNGRCIDF